MYTSNVFAILGLRALYFALSGMVDKFRYLKYGLSLVLIFIGLKMIYNYPDWLEDIPTDCFAFSSATNSFFDSFPIKVFGNASRNSISAGISIFEMRSLRNTAISSCVTCSPARSLTNAFGASPRYLSGMPITVASSTAGCS